MALKVEIAVTQVIKPSSPTPHHLKSFKLSVLDQNFPSFRVPLVLFYKKNPSENHDSSTSTISLELKASLSQVLTRFYPLAARINGNSSVIECKDDGVPYSEATVVNSTLCDILEKPDLNMMDQLIPDLPNSSDGDGDDKIIPLLVQVSFFECGGFAIGIRASHAIVDAATLLTFIREWAKTCRLEDQKMAINIPDFRIPSLFPPVDLSYSKRISLPDRTDGLVLRRFVFDASGISSLKARLIHPSATTTVQAISALIWKCATKSSRTKSSMLVQVVNMRPRVDPPLPEHSFGNFVWRFWAEKNDEDKMELDDLVDKQRLGFKELRENFIKHLVQGKEGSYTFLNKMKEAGDAMTKDGVEIFPFSSWCGFGFYDAADFGWGRPEWISFAKSPIKNGTTLINTKQGDGVEAWINLGEEHMATFEQDQELLAFASVDPSIS